MLHRLLRHRNPSQTLATILASSCVERQQLGCHLSINHKHTAPTSAQPATTSAAKPTAALGITAAAACLRLASPCSYKSRLPGHVFDCSVQQPSLAMQPTQAQRQAPAVHQPHSMLAPPARVATPRHHFASRSYGDKPLETITHVPPIKSHDQARTDSQLISNGAHNSQPVSNVVHSRHMSTHSQPALAAASNTPPSLGPISDPGAVGPVPSPNSLAWQVQRGMSDEPQGAVYTGPSTPSPKHVTLRTLRQKYARKEPITMVTAYDYPSAVHVDEAGIDILLIGDSVAMVVHGHDTTLPISMDEMLVHCRSVARGARRAFLVGDMPFGSYETGVRDAVISAMRMLKEGGVDAVKLEGGSPARVDAAKAVVEAGVAVMGHVGLTPQSISVLGGFRPQAQVADEALNVLRQAQALQRAGCFALVLECVPGPIAAAVTASVDIPTIGIGAGGATSGQVLVYHDLLGMMSHPHHAKVTPKFCKQYAQVGKVIQAALQQYREEVTSREFPSATYSPYRIPQEQLDVLVKELRQNGAAAAAQAVEETIHAEMAPHN